MKHKLLHPLIVAFAVLCSGPASAIPLLTNGNFETGTLAGWTTTSQPGSSSAGFFLDAPGTTTPVSGFATAANVAGGTTYAVSDQGGPGTYALLQGFTVPLGATSVTLTYDMFVNDQSGVGPIVDASGLDHTSGGTSAANQHARVDILTAAAGAFSTAAVDVVANLYLGIDAGPLPNLYTSYLLDLTGFLTPGTSYQLRFAEVDNQGFFQQGVDNVSLTAAIPAPATLLLFGLGLLIASCFHRRQRTSSV